MANRNQRESVFALGTEQNDVLTGAMGDDFIEGLGGNDMITGKAGDDFLYGDDGDDRIAGNNGDDEIGGGEGDDHLTGGAGDDWLEGDAGDDLLNGNEGADWLQGGQGHDTLLGGKADDILWGDDGNDRLDGGSGADVLTGDQGNDRLNGGSGDDRLDGGSGNDILDGGKGSDQAVLVYESAHTDLVLNVQDSLRWRLDSNTGNWVSGTTDEFTHLRFWVDRDGDGVVSDADEVDYVTSAETFVLHSGSGDDIITAGRHDDQLAGGQGNDLLDGGDGVDTAHFNYENAQNDILFNPDGGVFYKPVSVGWRYDEEEEAWVSGTADSFTHHRFWSDENGNGIEDAGDQIDYFTSIEKLVIQAGNGNDVISGYGFADTLMGGGGADDLFGLDGDDHLDGGKGQDILDGGKGDDVLYGGKGRDSLYGQAGRDILNGGDGDDFLFDGDGNDIMTGGAGADKFWLWQNISHTPFDLERNIITDFNSEEGDRLVFDTASGNENSLADLRLSIRGGIDREGNENVAWISNIVGNHIYASLEGVDYRDITESTFDLYFEVV